MADVRKEEALEAIEELNRLMHNAIENEVELYLGIEVLKLKKCKNPERHKAVLEEHLEKYVKVGTQATHLLKNYRDILEEEHNLDVFLFNQDQFRKIEIIIRVELERYKANYETEEA